MMHPDTRTHDYLRDASGQDMQDAPRFAGLQQGKVLDRWKEPRRPTPAAIVVICAFAAGMALAAAAFAETVWIAHNAAWLDAEMGVSR